MGIETTSGAARYTRERGTFAGLPSSGHGTTSPRAPSSRASGPTRSDDADRQAESSREVAGAPKPHVSRRAIWRVLRTRGDAVAVAVRGMAEIRAAADHPRLPAARSAWIVARAIAVVRRAEPVRAPLPDVAGHVVEPEVVRAKACDGAVPIRLDGSEVPIGGVPAHGNISTRMLSRGRWVVGIFVGGSIPVFVTWRRRRRALEVAQQPG
jgi:hypothetical protein